MPFIHEPPPKPQPGVCSSCNEAGRVWRFGEETIQAGSGYTLSVSHALCRLCIEVIVDLVDEDID